jgi:hypothetical protein
MTAPTPRDRLLRAGLSAGFADLVLREHAHMLGDQLRAEAAVWGVDTAAGKVCRQNADLIDPKAQP